MMRSKISCYSKHKLKQIENNEWFVHTFLFHNLLKSLKYNKAQIMHISVSQLIAKH